MNCSEEIERLAVLSQSAQLDLHLNDLRIIVNCFKAIAYQMEVDGEEYLDHEGLALKSRLEETYNRLVEESQATLAFAAHS
jgi:hypothetical protein